MTNHVAILLPRYIRMILSGEKTVESRLTKTPRPPFEAIAAGDRIFFKASAGPFRATAVASEVECRRDLTAADIRSLRRKHQAAVCGDDAYWQWKRNSRFATFITLRDVEPINVGPTLAPSRGPAWFVLDDRHPTPDIFEITITDGAIRNGYLRLPQLLRTNGKRTAPPGKTQPAASQRTQLEILVKDEPVVHTELTTTGMVHKRHWRGVYERANIQPGDRARLVEIEPHRFRLRWLKTS